MTWLPKSVVCLSYYDRFRFRSDAIAASLLALQTLPLAIAIAIAIGVHPLYGILSTAMAGLLASALGESKIRVNAPNVVFVAVASGIVAHEGILALSLTTLVAGVLLTFFGALGFGAGIRMLPRHVVAGFTTGIAVLVVSQQVPHLFGIAPQVVTTQVSRAELTLLRFPAHIEQNTIGLAVATLILTAACRGRLRYVPVGLIMVATGILLVKFAHLPVSTVESLLGSSQISFPLHPTRAFRLDLLESIFAQGFALAVLAAIESHQAMTRAAKISGEHFHASGELFVQGGANAISAFAGGIPTSGLPSSTLDNAHVGAQTPIAGILQAIFLILFGLLVAPLVRFIPLAVASVLVLASVFEMMNWREALRLLRVPSVEAVALVVTAVLVIIADLPVAITVGLFIAMFLHIRKKAAILGEGSPGPGESS